MSDQTTRPKQSVVVTTYAELEQYVRAFAAGNLNLLILIGRAGLAKSQSVRRSVTWTLCTRTEPRSGC